MMTSSLFIDIALPILTLLLGMGGMRLFMRRPKKFLPEDSKSGSDRYQEFKAK